jgi:hypothetical protein
MVSLGNIFINTLHKGAKDDDDDDDNNNNNNRTIDTDTMAVDLATYKRSLLFEDNFSGFL